MFEVPLEVALEVAREVPFEVPPEVLVLDFFGFGIGVGSKGTGIGTRASQYLTQRGNYNYVYICMYSVLNMTIFINIILK